MPKARSYHILDRSDVRLFQIQILIGSSFIFGFYGILLTYYQTIFSGLLLYIGYISTQVPIGFSLTRYFQGLGKKTKRKLKLINPSSLGADWNLSHQYLHTGELGRIFEDFSFQLQKYDPAVDDVIDLTWFGVMVWAVLSTAIIAVSSPPALFYATPSLFLAGFCVASYYNGYRTAGMEYNDENIEHLKHLVLSRLSAFQKAAGKRHFQLGVRWMSKGKKQVLGDIFIQILDKSREQGSVICYWLGLSSSNGERLSIDVPEEDVKATQGALMAHQILADFGWKIYSASKNAETRIELRNEQAVFRIDDQSTIVHSPSRVKETSEMLADALSAVFHEIGC